MGSVRTYSLLEYVNSLTGTPYHVTLKPKEWWSELFLEHGLKFVESSFEEYEFYRGVGGRFQDVHSYRQRPEAGFHFVAKRIMNPCTQKGVG